MVRHLSLCGLWTPPNMPSENPTSVSNSSKISKKRSLSSLILVVKVIMILEKNSVYCDRPVILICFWKHYNGKNLGWSFIHCWVFFFVLLRCSTSLQKILCSYFFFHMNCISLYIFMLLNLCFHFGHLLWQPLFFSQCRMKESRNFFLSYSHNYILIFMLFKSVILAFSLYS